MRLSRLQCQKCREETIHVGVVCVHCGTRFLVGALLPRLSDTTGSTVIEARRKRGGRSSKLNPRRALNPAH